MTAGTAECALPGRSWLGAGLGRLARSVVCILLCLTPLTAIVVLGWLTRKTASDVEARLAGGSPRRPTLIVGDGDAGNWFVARWISILVGGLWLNLSVGIRAWIAVLIVLAPFELIWLAGWVAGWENSFNKAYESSGVWPLTSLAAVLLSLPVLALVPMAIAHQAVEGRITSILAFGKIVLLVRAAGLRYLWLLLIIAIGCVGVFGVRALPVFAEHYSARVASGDPEQIAAFARQFTLAATALLFVGLLVVRAVMAATYARARRNLAAEKVGGWLKTGVVLVLAMALWLAFIFLIYLAQFLNYNWWSWINQPVLMLPWLGAMP